MVILLLFFTGVIEFLTSGRVSADHADFKELGYKSVLQKISGCDKPNELTHSFKLASAYSEDIMPFTNYTYVIIIRSLAYLSILLHFSYHAFCFLCYVGSILKVSSIISSIQNKA